MIDLHSHILPGVDDGASNLEESLAILKKMEQKGLKKIAATPHYPLYQNKDYKKFIGEKIKLLKEKAELENIDIEIFSGSEILIEKKLPWLLNDNKLMTINDSDYLLLETHPILLPDYFPEIIHDIQALGFKIIIAHPERYSFIQKNPALLYDWIEVYDLKLMPNSSSIMGMHGKKAEKTAENIVEAGLCHLMSSDTHGIDKRPFTLKQGLKKAEKIRKGSSQLFAENAEAVLKNEELQNFKIKEKRSSLFDRIFSFII
jgi:protein-tyrosine phosphatase